MRLDLADQACGRSDGLLAQQLGMSRVGEKLEGTRTHPANCDPPCSGLPLLWVSVPAYAICRLHGCMGAQKHGAWVQECMDAWVHSCMSAQTQRCMGARVQECVGTMVHGYWASGLQDLGAPLGCGGIAPLGPPQNPPGIPLHGSLKAPLGPPQHSQEPHSTSGTTIALPARL